MVSRVKPRQHRAPMTGRKYRRWARRTLIEIAIAIFMISIFSLKLGNYIYPAALRPATVGHAITTSFHNTMSAIENLPFLNRCPSGQRMTDVPGGFVCAQGSQRNVYARIYSSYPLVGQGRESIYSDTDQGSIQDATDLLHNGFDLPRYKPVQLPGLPTWSENPYSAVYWRLEFYSLRPSLNLLYAYRATGRAAYARQLRRLDLSFIAAEDHSRWAWADPHAVAFRCMALVDTWWKLRQAHQLPEATSTSILRELVKTGDYLSDPNNYQPEDNHGTNEAAALFNLAVAFPSLPHARQWLALADQRFEWQLNGLIDADGQLIENSPYYDFYTLEKYWQIYKYAQAQDQKISGDFAKKITKMLHFATYILQPNSQVPLLGASIEATINDFGVYRGLAGTDPQFLYALTHGSQGSAPPQNSISFPASSLSIFRSGWGKGTGYTRSTYMTYNIGRYRTEHSNLDALAITLYGDGGDLLPDSGLFTYSPGRYRNYFHGTISHNTVVVDGKSQTPGNGSEGKLVTRDGVTYQSAESSLYRGVTHRRLVMMIDPDHILVVDRLSSRSVHTYSQLFHLFPGARLVKHGLTVSGIGGTPRRQVTIQQLHPQGITESSVINHRGRAPNGLCSDQYGRLLPCYAVSYDQRGQDAYFMTLLTVGAARQHSWSATVTDNGQGLRVHDGSRELNLRFGQSGSIAPKAWATNPVPPRVKTPVAPATALGDWTAEGAASQQAAAQTRNASMTSISTNSQDPAFLSDNLLQLNLQHRNARLRLKVTGFARLSDFRLMLSNDHWAKYVTMNLSDAYTRDYAGQWADVFVGPSGRWGQYGGWLASGAGFDWGKIDGIRLEVSTRTSGGPPVTVSIGALRLLPAQKEGKLVFIFDDGYQSILPAASYMHKKGLAGNVAVIGKYVDNPTQDHLNLYQLKTLQNNWGWDMVNHTQDHVDAVQTYYDQHDLSGYAADILQQAVWLETNGLNSAPNWLIYPHGSINEALEHVVARYYMFARVVADNPDAWPYGDPHAISDLEIQYPGDGEGGDVGYTPPAEIISAVHQAINNHMTLILTFHRIHSEHSDPPGYPLALFKRIVNGVLASHIKVMNLSQLDRSNGIPLTNRIHVIPGHASLITVGITR